ncbi:beta-lactamase class A [Haloactinospora alba]|uniref:Beta-lactamase class A n=1 Tax=Haloactinospora alba TaxID=405555 RepID=A0A543NA31_9ACTN|nr:serine hydrolase [Haloactinospora alba]TQN28682.1 beta-lactamase class A [Haloactinospora alba]
MRNGRRRNSPSGYGRHPRRAVRVAAFLATTALLTNAAACGGSSSPTGSAGPSGSADPAAQRGPGLDRQQHERVTTLLDRHTAEHEGRMSVVAREADSGLTYSYGKHRAFHTASLVKLEILFLLLLRAEEEDRALTGRERSLASAMIRSSDNGDTDELYTRVGAAEAMAEGHDLLGLERSGPSGDARWGVRTTTASDQMRVLRALVTDDSPLTQASQDYARELLADVAPGQSWGVSAAAGPSEEVELKNGWLPWRADSGRWVVNSAGHIVGEDREYLVVVLSGHHRDYSSGIARVEHVASEVVDALDTAAE